MRHAARLSFLFSVCLLVASLPGSTASAQTAERRDTAPPNVANPADSLPWPPEDNSPCRGRAERLFDAAMKAADTVVATANECGRYFGSRRQEYVDAVARFAPIQPPAVGLTLMTEEIAAKFGKHATRCALRGLVTGTMAEGNARSAALNTIDTIGEAADLSKDLSKSMGIISGLWRTGGLDTFQLDLQKARFEGLLDLKARDRLLKGPKKYRSLYESVRELFQDGEEQSREALASARESVSQCRFDESNDYFDVAMLHALHTLHESRMAIRSDQAALRCDNELGGTWDRPSIQLSIESGMGLEARLSDYVHEIAQAKAEAQEERRRTAEWIGKRKTAMNEAARLVDSGDPRRADAALRHIENVYFKVCPDEKEWQEFLALRRRLYDKERACDVTGSWLNAVGSARSTWDISRNARGQYEAIERGLGNARSTSVTVTGNTLRLAFITGEIEGYYQWQLAPDCKTVTDGVLVFTRGRSGTHTSTLLRQESGPGPEGDWFCCEWVDPISKAPNCGPMRHRLVCMRDKNGTPHEKSQCNAFTLKCTK